MQEVDTPSSKKLPVIIKIIWAFTITAFVCALVSGLHLLFAKAAGEHTITLKRIEITELKHREDLDFSNIKLSSGSSETCELEITTTINEPVYYYIYFSNHTISEIDKQLYIAIENLNKDKLMNNTLYQIFDKNLSVEEVRMPSKRDVLKFTFSLSEFYRGDYNFDFTISLYAEGRPLG